MSPWRLNGSETVLKPSRFDDWREYYNTVKPHPSLNHETREALSKKLKTIYQPPPFQLNLVQKNIQVITTIY